MTVPGIYIALMTHDIKVFPSNLAISISSAREGVPLGVIIECLVMIFVFEILREAGIRVPGSMGSALGIVGGLVIGQASVEAKLISAPTVIIIAFTGITGLMLPKLKSAVITLRLLFVASAAAFGLMGIYLCSLFVLARLMSLKSFGVDYTSYMLSTESIKNHRDTFVRMPMWKMDKRPSELTNNKIRLRYGEGDDEE